MGIKEILFQIDDEIARLERARTALLGASASPAAKAASFREGATRRKRKKRKLTPEGRKRISEAVKRRWTAQKKLAAGE